MRKTIGVFKTTPIATLNKKTDFIHLPDPKTPNVNMPSGSSTTHFKDEWFVVIGNQGGQKKFNYLLEYQ